MINILAKDLQGKLEKLKKTPLTKLLLHHLNCEATKQTELFTSNHSYDRSEKLLGRANWRLVEEFSYQLHT